MDEGGTVRQERFIGQRSALRFFDLRDEVGRRRMYELIQSDEVKSHMEGVDTMIYRDAVKWIRDEGREDINGRKKLLMAVSGSDGVQPAEYGWIQGFVYGYSVEGGDLEVVKKWFGENIVRKEVYEVSFARRPEAQGRQMASALRQFCIKMEQLMGKSDAERMKPEMVVIAYVDPENVSSVRVLEGSGFVRKSEVVHEGEEVAVKKSKTDEAFVLDWRLLNKILKESGAGEWGVSKEAILT